MSSSVVVAPGVACPFATRGPPKDAILRQRLCPESHPAWQRKIDCWDDKSSQIGW